uniref:Reverse transcriptase domain-containing protein n=1 Tax=Romanomermis culicivorax TaxID=13658 RepID=A0A915KB71_ROMCU
MATGLSYDSGAGTLGQSKHGKQTASLFAMCWLPKAPWSELRSKEPAVYLTPQDSGRGYSGQYGNDGPRRRSPGVRPIVLAEHPKSNSQDGAVDELFVGTTGDRSASSSPAPCSGTGLLTKQDGAHAVMGTDQPLKPFGDRVVGSTLLNDSRSQEQQPQRTVAPCEQVGRESHSKRAVKWNKEDGEALVRLIDGIKAQHGHIIRTVLRTEWDRLTQKGDVSQTHRTVDGLVSKYSAIVKPRQPVAVPPLVDLSVQPEQGGTVTSPESVLTDATLEGTSHLAPEVKEPEDQLTYSQYVAQFQKHLLRAKSFKSRAPLIPIRNNKVPATLLEFGNKAVSEIIESNPNDLTALNSAVYSAAKVTQDVMFGNLHRAHDQWVQESSDLRHKLLQELGWLCSVMAGLRAKGSLTARQKRNFNALHLKYGAKYEFRLRSDHISRMEVLYHDLTQHLAKSQRLETTRREEIKRQRTRKMPLGQVLRQMTVSSDTPVQAVRDYWEKVIGTPHEFRMNSMLTEWQQQVQKEVALADGTDTNDQEVWELVCKKARPFKAAGPDRIYNFWWKILPSARKALFELTQSIKAGHHQPFPSWVAEGRAISLYKGSGEKSDPGSYRTIACLNSCYKLVTGVITKWIERSIQGLPSVLPSNQLAVRKGIWATTHAHILDRTAVKDAARNKCRPLSMAWIDFAKAFDSVPHSYIHWVLEIIGTGKYRSGSAQADELDKEIRNLLAQLKVRHYSSNVGRLYLESAVGGVGLRTLTEAVDEATIYSYSYLALRTDLDLSWKLMESLEASNKRNLISDFRQATSALNLTVERHLYPRSLLVNGVSYTHPTKAAQTVVKLLREKNQSRHLESLMTRKTASQVFHNPDLDPVRSHYWSHRGLLCTTAANNVMAAQEGQLVTRTHPKVSVSWHKNIITQENRKYAKYAVNSTLDEGQPLVNGTFPPGASLATEMGVDFNARVDVIPVVMGACGEVSTNLASNLGKLGFPQSTVERLIARMARSAALGSARIIKAHCSKNLSGVPLDRDRDPAASVGTPVDP